MLQFYDYIVRHEEYSNNVSERLKKFVTVPSRNFKGFLYGIAYEKQITTSNILKLKVPKSKPKTLFKEQITIFINSCTNYKDKFLLMLLYETGLRIVDKLQLIKSSYQNKYDEIIEYLKQDNDKLYFENKSIDFSNCKNILLKNELKFYIIYNLKEDILTIFF